MPNARFWHYGQGAALITLKPGQTLTHHWGARIDEGYSREWHTWSFDGTVVTLEYASDGTDCDGRLTQQHTSACPCTELRAGYNDPELGVTYPAWRHGDSSQRDYTAEAAGY